MPIEKYFLSKHCYCVPNGNRYSPANFEQTLFAAQILLNYYFYYIFAPIYIVINQWKLAGVHGAYKTMTSLVPL